MTIKSSPVIHALPYPVLEAGNLSFPEGSYDPSIKMGQDGYSVEIEHNISGVPFIEKLIEEGVIGFYCLFSIAKAGIRELRETERVGKIEWDDSIIAELPKLRPMLVYTGENREHKFTKKCGVADLWQGKTIPLPKGARLARGSFLNVNSSEYSFLRFSMEDDYDDGCFNVEENTEDGFYFTVKAAPDVFKFVQKPGESEALRHGLLTAVVAQCFSILKAEYKESDDNSNDSFPNLKILSAKLESEYGCDWNDENFDPMLAATTLYPFQVPNSGDEEEAE